MYLTPHTEYFGNLTFIRTSSKPHTPPILFKMRLITTLLATAFALASFSSAEGLEIEYLTPEISCERKTKKGDTVDMHYAGSLKETGKEFDSSYSRGNPLSFQLGAGRVIKG